MYIKVFNIKLLCIFFLLCFVHRKNIYAIIITESFDNSLDFVKKSQEILSQDKLSESANQNSKKVKKDHVYFKSEKLWSYFNKGVSKLQNNVLIKQTDLTLTCDLAFIYFDEKKITQKVEALGNVHIIRQQGKNQERIDAYSKRAVYTPGNRKLSLIENAKIVKSNEIIKGNIINYSLKTEELTGENIDGYLVSKEKIEK